MLRLQSKLLTAFGAVLAAATLAGAASAVNLNANASLILFDQENVTCPPGVPTDGSGCTHVTGSGRFRGLGKVAVDELVSFLRGPQQIIGSGTLTVAGKGTIDYSLAGDARTATYNITNGTGIYAGATGGGTISGPISTTGQTGSFTFGGSGSISASSTSFDTTPPRLSIGKAVVTRAGSADRVKLPLRASDNSAGPLTYELVVRGGMKAVKKAGRAGAALQFSVRVSKRTHRLTATLTVYDDSANATTRTVRIALPS